MFEQMKQFVSTFRELEKQQPALTDTEMANWEKLREKLSRTPPPDRGVRSANRRIIVVASFYPQAGASFLAGNFAFLQGGNDIPTILCEPPGSLSYYYFALDSERRSVRAQEQDGVKSKQIDLHDGMLQVKVTASLEKQAVSQREWTSWILANQKEASLLIIDLSSEWRGEMANWVMQLADEIWFVLDADFPRLTRLLLTESPPPVWNEADGKVKIIANRWNQRLAKQSVLKRLEGTLSLWDLNQQGRKIDACVPQVNGEKVSFSQLEASFYLEKYPEEAAVFEHLANL